MMPMLHSFRNHPEHEHYQFAPSFPHNRQRAAYGRPNGDRAAYVAGMKLRARRKHDDRSQLAHRPSRSDQTMPSTAVLAEHISY